MSVIVSRLALDHFRSWDHCIIDLPEGITVIQGANGMGKTNLVEAIEVLSTGSSHRTSSSLPLVQRGYDSATVRANIVDTNVADGEAAGAQPRNIAESANTELASDSSESSSEEQNGKLNSNQDSLQNSSSGHGDAAQPDRNTQNRAPYTTIELTIRAHGANRARIDGGASMYMRDILGRIPSVSFTPEDQRLVSGDPATRRGFINQAGTLLIPGYDEVHQTCAKIARQRAALLKQLGKPSVQDGRYDNRYGQSAPSDADAGQAAAMQPALSGLEIWTGQFIESGVELTRMRKRLIDQLAPLFSQNYDALSGSKQHASLVYLPSFDEVLEDGEPHQLISRHFQRIYPGEVARGQNLIGPHRDDMAMTLDGVPAKEFASNGEMWTMALALKMALAALVERATGNAPMVILDDVFAQLDETRRRQILEFAVRRDQVLITAAAAADVPDLSQYGTHARIVDIAALRRQSDNAQAGQLLTDETVARIKAARQQVDAEGEASA